MIDVAAARAAMRSAGLELWAEHLPVDYAEALAGAHGRIGQWQQRLRALPDVGPGQVRLDSAVVSVGDGTSATASVRSVIADHLRAFHPWRKGPFSIHGVHIDAEWRSDLKWERVAPHISPLKDRAVLDVGAGNGYYAWRMAGGGARLVVGIDPGWLYIAQFCAVRHFIGTKYPVFLLPFGLEDIPRGLAGFDTVLSMGVFYHRRSPVDHLLDLRDTLRPGGELVLETLVVDGPAGRVLVPEGRYAKMRNVWFIPSVPTLEAWVRRCGFEAVRTVDVTRTTIDEQRRTPWMTFESLGDFLDAADPALTVEGHPAPLRAIVVARLPA